MNNLPILETCNGCSACCSEQCSPPMFVAFLVNPQWLQDAGETDRESIRNMPAAARAELDRYIGRVRRGEVSDGSPCCWLDAENNRCRWYEYRPEICRDFERGSAECHAWRESLRGH